jgi:hypothetical protein
MPEELFEQRNYSEQVKKNTAAVTRLLNLQRRHLNQEGKRAVIRDQLLETPGLADNRIAGMLGVHHTTVGTIRTELEQANQLAKLASSTGKDGKAYPRHVARAPKMMIEEAAGDQSFQKSLNRAGAISV